MNERIKEEEEKLLRSTSAPHALIAPDSGVAATSANASGLLSYMPRFRTYPAHMSHTTRRCALQVIQDAFPRGAAAAPSTLSILDGIEQIFSLSSPSSASDTTKVSVESSPAAIMAMGAASVAPQRVIRKVISGAASIVRSAEPSPLQAGGPCSPPVLVCSSTSALVEVFLQHHTIAAGDAVLVPGIMFTPHHRVLDVFRRWQLRVEAYDLVPTSLGVDLADLARLHRTLDADARKAKTGTVRNKPIIVLAGINGRFPSNASAARQFARRHGMLVVELHTPAATTLSCQAPPLNNNNSTHMYDLSITSFDGPGMLGGAIGHAPHAVVSRGLREAIKALPVEGAIASWLRVARHIMYRLLCNRLDYGSAVWTLAAILRARECLMQMVASYTEDAKRLKAIESAESYEERAMDWIYDVLLCPTTAQCVNMPQSLHRQLSHRIRVVCQSVREAVSRGGGGNGGAGSSAYSPPTAVMSARPHRTSIVWMDCFLREGRRRVDAECLSLWSFLASLPPYVEALSAGEAASPLECVEAASSNILLRAACPALVSQQLQQKGYGARPLRPVKFSGGGPITKTAATLTSFDVAYFAHCEHAAAMAVEVVVVPLSASGMCASSHRNLVEALQEMPRQWFTLRPNAAPRANVYNTVEVRAMLDNIGIRYPSSTRSAMGGGLAATSDSGVSRARSMVSAALTQYQQHASKATRGSWDGAQEELFREDTPWLTLLLYCAQALRIVAAL